MAINFEALTGWNGSKENHDSSLSADEMRELIMKIPTQIDDPIEGNCSCTEIKNLFHCFSDTPMHKLKLVKGIHQADKLHYTICLLEGGCFHIYVAQGPTKIVKTAKYGSNLGSVKSNMKKYTETTFSYDLFEYKNVGISYQLCDQNYKEKIGVTELWPAQFNVRGKYAGRVRGNSFSLGNSAPITAYAPNSGQVRKNEKPSLETIRNPPVYTN